ncbi:TauD/TfdA dioxygenase family protein [Streptomyces zagrosensis]|uniref:Alpha-ketoglutarate-dependent taurine dioxygenase n=1 Tax=Streptomyces zagrosensis TaxID=1042984 RepID=A0A7W9UYA8_9ACTN|nr:TauD/TfdA family dioxygenase [Streptomyces zagrosensis]MBB5935462.1 alpha-ketoglutarate-dependent taurine dioxygenase [Streptomyces zagrosensis]
MSAPDTVLTRGKPFGALVESRVPNADPGLIAPEEARALVLEHRVVVLRGFRIWERDEMTEYARLWGPLLSWNFGEILDLAVHDDPKDYVFTQGPVPYHWDGAFAEKVPSHQIFQCVRAPVAGGQTVFCDTGLVLAGLPAETRQVWERLNVTYRKEQTAHYGGHITAPLIQQHPHTDAPVVRYAEPLDPERFLSPLFLDVEGLPDDLSQEEFFQDIEERLYAEDVTYYHDWQDGDIVLTDNHALLHGRTAFSGSGARHLRRVHVL